MRVSSMFPSYRPIVLLLEEVPRRAQTARVLGRADFDVIEVQDTAEALETLEARSDVDVLLADIDVAGAVDGLELSRSVHERWPGLGLVLTSERVRHLSLLSAGGRLLPAPSGTRRHAGNRGQASGRSSLEGSHQPCWRRGRWIAAHPRMRGRYSTPMAQVTASTATTLAHVEP
jgi:CheY-like chemotaxis protein